MLKLEDPPPSQKKPPPLKKRQPTLEEIYLAELAHKNMMELEKKKTNMKKRVNEFLDKGVAMSVQKTIELKVQSACMNTDLVLAQKRTKLRELLLAEEVAHTAEYVALCQQANVNRKEELMKRASEIRMQNEKERKQIAERKILEWKLQSCNDARTAFNRQKSMELKKDHLWQIKEKYALEEAKREEDRMYHDFMIKNMMALGKVEEENAKAEWLKRKNDLKNYEEQMKWREQKKEEEKQLKIYEKLQLEQEIRLAKVIEEKELSKHHGLKSQRKAEVQEMLRLERETKEKRKREEEEIDRTFAELMKLEEEREKRKEFSNKERLKREKDRFLEKSRELKLQVIEEQRKLDALLEELNEKKRKQKEEELKQLKAAKHELFCNVMKEREKQVLLKKEINKKQEEEERIEVELLNLQIEQQRKIREDYEKRCQEQRELYRCQLLEQIRETREAKKIKKEEEERWDRALIERQQRETEQVKALLKTLPISGHDHPMKAILEGTPPKYVCPFPCPR